MAKNIVIAEGGTAKSFTAKKIQTKAQGNGTVNWIPEDEAVDYVRLVDKKFTAKGIYKPEDFNADGFGTVEVEVTSDVKEKTITANGVFYAADDGCMGYSKVTVAVPGGGGGGPFTVRFFDVDKQTILKTDANVPYDGSASCTALDGTIVNGQYFKGWNPSPKNVREDMNCYPVYGDYIIDPNEIQDDWETICADGGAHYPLGSYKSLVVNVPARTASGDEYCWNTTNDGKQYTIGSPKHDAINIAMHMVKVAEGEDGSNSTWLSTGVIPVHPVWTDGEFGNFGAMAGAYLASAVHAEGAGANYTEVQADWGNSLYREYLNEFLIENIPEVLGATIKQVNKQYASYPRCPVHTKTAGTQAGDTKVYKTSLDKIWIPSVKELHSYFASKNQWDTYSGSEEPTGIDYSAIYMPTYPQNHLTRTLHVAFRGINCISIQGGDTVTMTTTSCPGTPFGFCL